ncbi:hypothetical protein JNJ66_03680 [Candidatus Saccharibacteria bacterium]|nr:hypothetical protein [Candidatus Saccharibacteria bacterium]
MHTQTDSQTKSGQPQATASLPKLAGIFFLTVLLVGLVLFNFPALFSKPSRLLKVTATDHHQLSVARGETPFAAADIAAMYQGEDVVMLLTKDGAVYAKGSNRYGQLGLGSIGAAKDELHQVRLPQGTKVKQLDIKHNHAIVLTDKGEAWTWGMNISGQLGTGDRQDNATPVKVLDKVRDVAAGYRFSAAVRTDGTLWAWGMSCDPATPGLDTIIEQFARDISVGGSYFNGKGQGPAMYCIEESNLPVASLIPKQVATDLRFTSVSGGYGHIVMTDDKQQAWSLGCNAWGQLGRGHYRNDDGTRRITKIAFPDGVKVADIDAGFRHTVALDTEGAVWTWGHDLHGAALSYKSNRNDVPEKQAAPGTVTRLQAGHDETGILVGGSLYLAGDNDQGQISQEAAKRGEAAISSFTKVSKQTNVNGFSIGYLRQLYW